MQPLRGLTGSRPGRTGGRNAPNGACCPASSGARRVREGAAAPSSVIREPARGRDVRRRVRFRGRSIGLPRGDARLARASFARYHQRLALTNADRRRRLDTSANEPPSRSDPVSSHPARDAIAFSGPANAVREAGFPGAGGAPPGGPPRPMMPTAGPPGVGAAGGPGPRGPAMGGPVPVASGPGQIQAQFQGQPQARPAGSAPNGSAPNGFAPPTAQMARMGVGALHKAAPPIGGRSADHPPEGRR